jgi:hypothetical protein
VSWRLLAGMACALAMVFLAPGCGGGGSDSGNSQGSEASIKRANAVCVKSNKAAGAKVLAAYGRPSVGVANSETDAVKLETKIFMPILIEDAEAQLKGLKALEVPAGDEVGAILSAYEKWLEKATASPRQMVVASDMFNEARKLAGKYGFVKCELTPYEEPYGS